MSEIISLKASTIRTAATLAAEGIARYSANYKRADFPSCVELRFQVFSALPDESVLVCELAGDAVADNFSQLFGPVPGCHQNQRWLNKHGDQHGLDTASERNEWRITALLLFAAMQDDD